MSKFVSNILLLKIQLSFKVVCFFCQLEAVEQEEADTVDVPFDNVFVDYDDNEDDLIDFEEFYLTMTNNIPIANPALLGETFMAADANSKLYCSIGQVKQNISA